MSPRSYDYPPPRTNASDGLPNPRYRYANSPSSRLMLTPHAGAAPRVLLLVLVLVLMIPDTQVALAGLLTLVAVLPLGIQAVMAIRAVTLLQGTLAVLETTLLVPLVTTQNQSTEGCKRRVAHTWRSIIVTCACLSHPSIAYSRLCNTQYLISAIQHSILSARCVAF